MTTKDIMELSIPQLEYVLDGCSKNNEEALKETKNSTTNKLSGADAIQYLMNNEM